MAKVLRLKAEYRKAITDNPGLQGAIAQRTNKSMNAVWRWCRNNSEQLTMLSVVTELQTFLKLPKGLSMFEEIEVTEKAA